MAIQQRQTRVATMMTRFLQKVLCGSLDKSATRKGRLIARRGFFLACSLALWAMIISFVGAAPLSFELEEGLDFHKKGKYQEAIKAYTDALRKDPRSAEAYNWRGMAYDELGDLDKALQDLNEAIKLSPGYADAYNNRGEVYRKKKMLQQAMQDYNQAIKLDPNFAEAYYNQGLIHKEQNRYPQAAQAFQSYLRLKPDATDKQEVEEMIKALKTSPKAGEAPGGPPTKPADQKQMAQAPPAEKKTTAPQTAAKAEKPSPPAKQPGAASPPTKGVVPPGQGEGFSDMLQVLMSGDMTKIQGVLQKLIGQFLIFLALLVVLYWVVSSLPYLLLAKKTGTPSGWMAFVPVLDEYLKTNIAGKSTLLFILLVLGDPVVLVLVSILLGLLGSLVLPLLVFIVPFILLLMVLASVIAWVPVCMGIATAVRKPVFWGLLICVPIILVNILSFVLGFVAPELLSNFVVGIVLLAIGVLPPIFVPYYLALSK